MDLDFKERREQQEFNKEAVVVSFPTTADITEMTDEDLKNLGEFVVEIARDKRKRQDEGLV